jgi:tetratricopeptide (TPR) repeat protein
MRYFYIVLLIFESLIMCSYADDLDSIANDNLKMCISDYRDGYYGHTVDCIDQALPKLTTFRDSVDAFKILALSYGMLNQIDKSKEYFGLALEKDSKMNIDTLAFPPNIALIYNQVKLEKMMSTTKEDKPSQPVLKPALTGKRKKSAAAPILLTSVILSAGGAAGLYYNGYLARKEYSNLGNDQEMLNQKWKEFTYSIAGGIGCTVVSGLTTWLFFRVINKNAAVSISGNGDGFALVYKF